MTLLVSGTIPSVMVENSGASDWFGRLQVTPDRGAIVAVEAIGPGAPYLSLAWDPVTGTVAIRPGGAALDYESFVARGQVPELVFSLQATMRNGRIDADSPSFRIALLDADDTAPTGLAFATGGSLVAGAIGPVIGRLAVTDPDTPAGQGFHFSFPVDEAWRFEVVDGGTLKLREGISLGLDDMPRRPLVIEVSDGRQSAAFTIDLTVLDPGAPPPFNPMLGVGEARGSLALPEAERALVLRGQAALADLGPPAAGERRVAVAGTGEAALPASVARIDFLDARLELAPGGAGSKAAALQQVLGAADPIALARTVAGLDAGNSLAAQAAAALPAASPGAVGDDAGFVAGLFAAGGGRAPTEAELALQLGRLGSGVSRAQVAVDVALGLAERASPEPVWIPWSHGREGVLPDLAPPAAVLASPAPLAIDLQALFA